MIFPISSGGLLVIQKSLIDTLAIDKRLLKTSRHTKANELRVFLEAAQQAWEHALPEVESGALSIIDWLEMLIEESRVAGIWVPSVFLLRMHQFERRQLVLDRSPKREPRRSR